jgi:ADP-ribose pyrophosphatase
MGKPSLDAALAAYRSLIAARGELFGTPPGPAIEILTDEAEIRTTQRAVKAARLSCGLAADDVRVGVLLDDPYLLVMRDAVRFPDGELGLYNRIISSPNVVILPLLGDRVALIHRFRHGTRRFHYEAPRGIASGLDRLDDDARRELKEEIGAEAVELIDLGELHPYSGICNEMMRLYLARITDIGTPELHESITRIELFSARELEEMIRDGVVTDAPTLAVTLRARLRNLL